MKLLEKWKSRQLEDELVASVQFLYACFAFGVASVLFKLYMLVVGP